MAPADLRLATASASFLATRCSGIILPALWLIPDTARHSLTVSGTPNSGLLISQYFGSGLFLTMSSTSLAWFIASSKQS
uniref:Uncharacterized protein n=1 Tax=Panstrongylus lignarius TaxID=156445 RepID=A0A224XSZ6_9HEMI